MKQIILLFLIFIVWGCQPSMTGPTEVKEIRVMGIKMDHPEVNEGDSVTIESLISIPYNKQDATYTEGWIVCDPKGKDGINTCQKFSEENLYFGPVLNQNSFSFNIGANTVMDGEEDHLLYVIHFVCEDTLETCTEMVTGGGNFDISKVKTALKRLKVIPTGETAANHNPMLQNIYLDGAAITGNALTLKKDHSYQFKAMIDPSNIEKEPHPEFGEVDELITFSWATNLGSIEFRYTNQERGEVLDDLDDNELETPKEALNGPFQLYVTVFDGRGGVDWRVFDITLE